MRLLLTLYNGFSENYYLLGSMVHFWTHCVATTLCADSCVLTDENWAEEESDGDVDDWGRHVQKPVGAHGKESQEEQKEEQAVLVLLNLTGEGEMFREMLESIKNEERLKSWLLHVCNTLYLTFIAENVHNTLQTVLVIVFIVWTLCSYFYAFPFFLNVKHVCTLKKHLIVSLHLRNHWHPTFTFLCSMETLSGKRLAM